MCLFVCSLKYLFTYPFIRPDRAEEKTNLLQNSGKEPEKKRLVTKYI